MREIIVSREMFDLAAIQALEAALEARSGWVHAAISPFSIASRNALIKGTSLAKRPALLRPAHAAEELRLAG